MFSKVITLGKDPEMKTSPSGVSYVQFSGAYRLSKKDQTTGQYVSQWLRVVAFGKTAEIIAQHFRKGSKIFVCVTDLEAGCYISQNNHAPVATLDGKLVEFDFVEPKSQDGAPQQQYQQAQAPQMPPTIAQQQQNWGQQPPQQQVTQHPQYQQQAPQDDWGDEVPF